MSPKQELVELQKQIKLSTNEAVKRDCLECFLFNSEYDILLDADSLLFNVCSYMDGKSWSELIEGYFSQCRTILNYIEDQGYNIVMVRTFFTTCTNNFRLDIDKNYKGNRESNDLSRAVYTLKNLIIQELEKSLEKVYYSSTLEADDLIPMFARENSIIVSQDKDLKQIVGCHFDYKRVDIVNPDGTKIIIGTKINKKGEEVNVYQKKMKGFSFTSPSESTEILGSLLLEGDAADNIKGVKGIGKVKASKMLKGKSEYSKFRAVVYSYIKEGENWKEKLIKNYRLINLRTSKGVL